MPLSWMFLVELWKHSYNFIVSRSSQQIACNLLRKEPRYKSALLWQTMSSALPDNARCPTMRLLLSELPASVVDHFDECGLQEECVAISVSDRATLRLS